MSTLCQRIFITKNSKLSQQISMKKQCALLLVGKQNQGIALHRDFVFQHSFPCVCVFQKQIDPTTKIKLIVKYTLYLQSCLIQIAIKNEKVLKLPIFLAAKHNTNNLTFQHLHKSIGIYCCQRLKQKLTFGISEVQINYTHTNLQNTICQHIKFYKYNTHITISGVLFLCMRLSSTNSLTIVKINNNETSQNTSKAMFASKFIIQYKELRSQCLHRTYGSSQDSQATEAITQVARYDISCKLRRPNKDVILSVSYYQVAPGQQNFQTTPYASTAAKLTYTNIHAHPQQLVVQNN
eukprot:TRINITY_DN6093_c0_g1_i16.p1 TRINITY_DN6093_c0_g1~~TRINITY_DN6093_c0_g1_i16.p1  ORF type:complete len:294 (+),score=-14.83 TRINITY_DN6093_c0_g1_i16:852-1733(+)